MISLTIGNGLNGQINLTNGSLLIGMSFRQASKNLNNYENRNPVIVVKQLRNAFFLYLLFDEPSKNRKNK